MDGTAALATADKGVALCNVAHDLGTLTKYRMDSRRLPTAPVHFRSTAHHAFPSSRCPRAVRVVLIH
jgi:hypothetical protein